MKKCFVIAAGGTGGHIFPALAVADMLAQQGINILWLGVKGRMEDKLVQGVYPMEYISAAPLRGKGIKAILKMPLLLLRSVLQVKQILKAHHVVGVLCMGGFVSAPAGVAAKLAGLPLIIHEQNAIPGLANRCLSKLARHVLQAFPNTFLQKHKHVQCVGNPLRNQMMEIISPSERAWSKPLHVLVLGGSQGAHYLNTVVAKALLPFVGTHDIRIRHQSGAKDYHLVQEIYQKNAQVDEFISDMSVAYQQADLVIARSGALTVSEIATVGVASILVPFPSAVGDHQRYNASFLVDKGAAILMDQVRVTSAQWSECLQLLFDHPLKLQQMAKEAFSTQHQQAAGKVARICLGEI